jgi:hypothetical protein
VVFRLSVEGAIVSCGPVLMHLRLVQCHSGTSKGRDWKSLTFSESTSRKSLALSVVPGNGTVVWGEIHMNRGRVGEGRGDKEMDRCPLTV